MSLILSIDKGRKVSQVVQGQVFTEAKEQMWSKGQMSQERTEDQFKLQVQELGPESYAREEAGDQSAVEKTGISWDTA